MGVVAICFLALLAFLSTKTPTVSPEVILQIQPPQVIYVQAPPLPDRNPSRPH